MPSLLLPLLLSTIASASAAGIASVQIVEFGQFFENINKNIVAVVGVLLMSLAIVTFFAGLVRFIWSVREGDAKSTDQGKKFMMWSLLAIFIIFSLYGIIYFFQQTLGINGYTNIPKPCLNFVTDCKSGGGTGLAPTAPADSQTEVSDDCAKAPGKAAGSDCVLPNGTVGTCKAFSGTVLCATRTTTPTISAAARGACASLSAGRPCMYGDGDTGVISGACTLGTDGSLYCQGGARPVTQPPIVRNEDANCSTLNETCTDNVGAAGTCQSNGYGGFFCKPNVGRPVDTGTCYGKTLWAPCSYNGDTGSCYAQGGAQLYCAIGAVALRNGEYCNPQAHDNRFCGLGLSCEKAGLTGGNQLYSCQ